MKKIAYYIQSIRWFEIAVRMGAPVLALLMTAPTPSTSSVIKIVHALLAFVFLWAHIYAFNEWGGYLSDKAASVRIHTPLLAGKVSPREMVVLAFVCVFVSSFLYVLLDVRLLIIVLVNSIMGVLYVHPKILLKNVPCVSCAMLFLVSVGDFLLGWLVFSRHMSQGIFIGVFFGILGIVGQSYHESGDYDSDKRASIYTNAVRFGKKRLFVYGLVCYTCACVYFCALTISNRVAHFLYIPLVVTYPLYLFLFFRCLQAEVSAHAVRQFVRQYRLLYGVIGCAMIGILLIT